MQKHNTKYVVKMTEKEQKKVKKDQAEKHTSVTCIAKSIRDEIRQCSKNILEVCYRCNRRGYDKTHYIHTEIWNAQKASLKVDSNRRVMDFILLP